MSPTRELSRGGHTRGDEHRQRAQHPPVGHVEDHHAARFHPHRQTRCDQPLEVRHADDACLHDVAPGHVLVPHPGLVDAVRILSEGEPALVHCTVGKDRTGVIVALALSAVGRTAMPWSRTTH